MLLHSMSLEHLDIRKIVTPSSKYEMLVLCSELKFSSDSPERHEEQWLDAHVLTSVQVWGRAYRAGSVTAREWGTAWAYRA